MYDLLPEDATTSKEGRVVSGELLTSVFGANDEVYEGINALKRNGENILRKTTQQTMLINNGIMQYIYNIINCKLNQLGHKVNHTQK